MPANDDGSERSPAIDRPILEDLRDRFRTTEQFAEATITDDRGSTRLRVVLDPRYYPADGAEITLDVHWYDNDDFRIHYRETGEPTWQRRWDRHPNDHNTRDHYHPPPDAATPGEDASWPDDYRDVVGLVLDATRERVLPGFDS